METITTNKTIPQTNGIEVTTCVADFFDADALREPNYRLMRIDSKGYRYYCIQEEDGNYRFFISTTSLINATTPTSSFLIEWMISTPNHKEYAKERADYGTMMHILFGWFMIEKSIDLSELEDRLLEAAELKGIDYKHYWTEDLKCDLLSFATFIHDHNVKPLAIEVSLASRDGYAGTLDLICKMDVEVKGFFGELYASGPRKGEPKESKSTKRITAIVDFKSGRKSFYESNEIQLEASRRLCIENFDINPDMVFNFSPKEWRTDPDYHLKDQSDSIAKEKFRHLVEIAKIEKLMDVRSVKIFEEQLTYGEPVTDKNFRCVDLNEYLKQARAVKEERNHVTA